MGAAILSPAPRPLQPPPSPGPPLLGAAILSRLPANGRGGWGRGSPAIGRFVRRGEAGRLRLDGGGGRVPPILKGQRRLRRAGGGATHGCDECGGLSPATRWRGRGRGRPWQHRPRGPLWGAQSNPKAVGLCFVQHGADPTLTAIPWAGHPPCPQALVVTTSPAAPSLQPWGFVGKGSHGPKDTRTPRPWSWLGWQRPVRPSVPMGVCPLPARLVFGGPWPQKAARSPPVGCVRCPT